MGDIPIGKCHIRMLEEHLQESLLLVTKPINIEFAVVSSVRLGRFGRPVRSPGRVSLDWWKISRLISQYILEMLEL